ncbi:MAG: Polysaccharide biosynthesis protein [candidate division WS2 bacterium ADurb.Bin280]|uniref:Polysaccharide biosynthesis protein n=1 Tax=candidate division WS2 bacterium ADurb.Bin280 TaxID=1852829 RepID=A0A1V5SCR0_9BACT|nr:MAG: Polysaccharide biosynthesis protein [candidate division WS2 bacterium ADurb.Bin280]
MAENLKLNKEFSKNTVSVGINNVAVSIFGLLTAVILARALGPVNQGILALVITVADILNKFISLGTRSSVSYFINSNKYSASRIYGTVVSSSFFLSFLLAVGVVLVYRPHLTDADFFGVADTIYIPSFIAIFLILNFLRANVLGVFYALEKFKIANFNNLVYFGLPSLIFIVSWPFVKINIPLVLSIYILNSVISLILIFKEAKKLQLNPVGKFESKLFMQILTYGLPVYYNSLSQTIQQRAGIFVISSSLGLSHVGYFTFAYSIADKLSELSKPLVVTHFPKVTQLQNVSTKVALSFTKSILSKLAAVYLIVLIPFIVLTPLLVPVLFSDAYRPSIVPAIILSITISSWGLIGILNNFFASCNLQLKNSIILTFGLTLNILGLSVAYFLGLGILWISIIISLSSLANFVVQLVYIKIRFKTTLANALPDFVWVLKLISKNLMRSKL